MKRTPFIYAVSAMALIAAFASLVSLASCGGVESGGGGSSAAVTGITVDPGSVQLSVGSSRALKATVLPSDAANKVVTWRSTNPGVASLASSGTSATVTAHGPGDATIFVVAQDGGFQAECAVHVPVPVAGVALEPALVTMAVGGAPREIKAILSPANASDQNVLWSNGAPAVVSLAHNGLNATLTPLSKGNATVRVTAADGGHTATCTVTVTDQGIVEVLPVSVTVTPDALTLGVGEGHVLSAIVDGAGGLPPTNPNVAWVSSNPAVVSISPSGNNCTISALAVGEATVAASSVVNAALKGECHITVSSQPGGAPFRIDIAENPLNVAPGASGTLHATVYAADGELASSQTVNWITSDSNVVYVSPQTGTYLAGNVGNATVTAISPVNFVTGACAVAVAVPPASVTIAAEKYDLVAGDTLTLTATVLAAGGGPATNQAVTWASSNTSVATVSPAGLSTAVLHAVAAGTVTITAASAADPNVKGTCALNVSALIFPAASVGLNKAETSIDLDKTETLVATVYAADGVTPATNQLVGWISFNEGVAKVLDGLVTPVALGTTNILVVSVDGNFNASCRIDVVPPYQPVTGVRLDRTALALKVGGQSIPLAATVEPANATNKGVTWESSDTGVVTVNANGLVSLAPGVLQGSTAVITVRTDDGGFTAACAVTVAIDVTSVSLDKHGLIMGVTGTERVEATVVPNNATNMAVAWFSDNPIVAEVVRDERYVDREIGIIKAKAPGNARITVVTVDGGHSDVCVVDVTNALVLATGVTLNKASLTLGMGGRETLEATVQPNNATNKGVTWESSAPSVAMVLDGTVVANASSGTAVITVTTDDIDPASNPPRGYQATCVVTVEPTIGVTGIMLDKPKLDIGVGASDTVEAALIPFDATNRTVNWQSSNEAVATVSGTSPTGAIVSAAPGATVGQLATITARPAANPALSARLNATIVRQVPVTGLTLTKTSTLIGLGGSEALVAIIEPENATIKGLSWSSSNNTVATVTRDGVVNAHAYDQDGTAVITVTTIDIDPATDPPMGFQATCVVSVTPVRVPATGVTLNKNALPLAVGGSETLVATVLPDEASDKRLRWSSSNNAVATVSADGTVYAHAAGAATVSVSTIDPSPAATCVVTVTAPISVIGVTLAPSSLVLEEYNSQRLTATVLPANATNKRLAWTSTNNAIASVTSDGEVTAMSAGSATIVVTTDDGGFQRECSVTVTPANIPVADVLVMPRVLTLAAAGATGELTAAITGANGQPATNQYLVWTSSNDQIVAVSGLNPQGPKVTVTAVAGSGSATIQATSVADSTKFDTCVVTVGTGGNVLPTSIRILPATPDPLVAVAGGTINLDVTVLGAANALAAVQALDAVVVPSQESPLISATVTPPAQLPGTWQVTTAETGTFAVKFTSKAPGISLSASRNLKFDSLNVPATGVTIAPTSSPTQRLPLTVGGASQALAATVSPANASDKSVGWASSAPSIASVASNNGTATVTAVAPGEATITVTTASGGHTAMCYVSVAAGNSGVTGVTVSPSTKTLTVGDLPFSLSATVLGAGVSQNVTWDSENKPVATVSTGGNVTAVSPGIAVIRATSVADTGVSGICTVTVSAEVPASIAINVNGGENMANLVYKTSGNLTAVVTGDKGTTPMSVPITWGASPAGVVTVTPTSPGASTATYTTVGSGTATITASQAINPITGTLAGVNVTVHPTAIVINDDEDLIIPSSDGPIAKFQDIMVVYGDLAPPVYPDKYSVRATNQVVTWTSDNNSVIEITNPVTGAFDINGEGDAEITATTTSGAPHDGVKGTCKVTVSDKLVVITPPAGGIVDLGETGVGPLLHSVIGLIPNVQTVTWKSSDGDIVYIDPGSGKYDAKTKGEVTITAMSTEDPSVTGTCKLTVVALPHEMTLSESDITIDQFGGGITLSVDSMSGYLGATVDAGYTDVEWVSDTPLVATVDEATGEVTPKGKGKTVITAKSKARPATTKPCNVTVEIWPYKIILSPLALSVEPDETLTNALTATVLGADDTTPAESNDILVDYQAVAWSVAPDPSSPTVVVKVAAGSAPGKYDVSAETVEGKATVTATSAWSKFPSAVSAAPCIVTVEKVGATPVKIEIDHADLPPNITGLSIDMGTSGATASTGTLTARALDSGGGPAGGVTWTATGVVSIGSTTGDYSVSGVGIGDITATSTVDTSLKKTIDVTVEVNAWGVKIQPATYNVTKGTSNLTLTAKVVGKDGDTPADAGTWTSLSWAVEPTNYNTSGVIGVSSSGLLTAAVSADGDTDEDDTADITVALVGGKQASSDTVKVTVKAAPPLLVTDIQVTAPNDNWALAPGETKALDVNITPGGAANKNVTWSVPGGDELDGVNSVGTYAKVVMATGVVTGILNGSETIVATAADGSGVTGSHAVTVETVPTGITINNKADVDAMTYPTPVTTLSATVENARHFDITSLVNPNDITWDSDTPAVVTVTSPGVGTTCTPKDSGDGVTIKVSFPGLADDTCTANVTTVIPAYIKIIGTPAGSVSSASLDLEETGSLTWEVYGDADLEVLAIPSATQAVTWGGGNAYVSITNASTGAYEATGSGSAALTATSAYNSMPLTNGCTIYAVIKPHGAAFTVASTTATAGSTCDLGDLLEVWGAQGQGGKAADPGLYSTAWTFAPGATYAGTILVDPDTGELDASLASVNDVVDVAVVVTDVETASPVTVLPLTIEVTVI